MKKWKWFGLGGLGVVGCALGLGYYYYQQVTYLPDWYEAESEFQEFNPEFNRANAAGELFPLEGDVGSPQPIENVEGLERLDSLENAEPSDSAPSSEVNEIKQELQTILEEYNRALASPSSLGDSTQAQGQGNETQANPSTNPQQNPRTGSNNLDLTPQTPNSPATSPGNSPSEPSLSPTLPSQDVEIILNQGQIRQIVGEDRQLSERNRAFLESTQGVRANINEDQLELGAVVSLADVPLNLLSADKRRIAEKVLRSNPALRNRSVYVALEGNYQLENGQIRINSNTQLSVGNMRFSLQELSQRTGVSQSQIERLINEQLNTQLRYLNRL